MTTATWSSGNAHTSDADFRAWGSEFSAKLAAVGLVQTADTGQINWLTVTRPAGSADGGYEIWRFDDSLQATSPIFLKFYYGSYNTSSPRLQVEVGTGTNGAGTITGAGAGVRAGANLAISGTGTATPTSSYMCYTEGFFGFRWKVGSTPHGTFVICRTCDGSGVPDGYGALIWAYGTTVTNGFVNNTIMLRFAATASVIFSLVGSGTSCPISFVPGNLGSSTLPSGDKQAWMCWGSFPDMRPMFGLGAVIGSEIAALTTFSVAMVGSTARTFLQTGIGANVTTGGHQLAMLWE